MPLVPTITLKTIYAQKSPSMNGSDKLYQDRLQRDAMEQMNQIVLAIKEIQDYLA